MIDLKEHSLQFMKKSDFFWRCVKIKFILIFEGEHMKFLTLMLISFVMIDLAHSRKPRPASYECEAHTECGTVAGSEGCGFNQDKQTTYSISMTTFDANGNCTEVDLPGYNFNSQGGCQGCAKLLKRNPNAGCGNFN